MTPRQAALMTGMSIVLMTIFAGITMGGVFVPLFEMDSAEFSVQASGLTNNFLFGIFGWIMILITDVLASWGLYRFYAVKNEKKARIMAALRLIYSAILLVGIVQLIRSFLMISGSSADYANARELLFSFQAIWQFGLIIFGVHLLYLSRLVCEKRTIKQVIAILLFIAGIGYIGSNTADLFIDNYEQIRAQIEVYFILPMLLGEFSLAIWLLWKGGRNDQKIMSQCAS